MSRVDLRIGSLEVDADTITFEATSMAYHNPNAAVAGEWVRVLDAEVAKISHLTVDDWRIVEMGVESGATDNYAGWNSRVMPALQHYTYRFEGRLNRYAPPPSVSSRTFGRFKPKPKREQLGLL